MGSIWAHLRHQSQSAAYYLFGQYLRLCCERPQPQHDCDVAHIPAFTKHHHANDHLNLAFGFVDVAGRFASLINAFLGDLAFRVGMDNKNPPASVLRRIL